MEERFKIESFITNISRCNSTITTNCTRKFVFAPVSNNVKLMMFTAMLSFGLYGLTANSLILYFKHKQHRSTSNTLQRPCRRNLTEYFIQSLCLSDILCSLISLPLYSTEMFVSFVTRDWICRFSRFFITIFPVVTILNLLVIGVERYIVIFHPFFSLRRKSAKKMVVGSWVLGALITLMSVVFVRLVKHDIGENLYTLVCKYDKSVLSYRAFFTGFIFISYIAPSFILTFINLRILKRQRNVKRVDASQTTQRAVAKLKVTRMFVSLIFAFIIPYAVFVAYSSFRTAAKSGLSFSDDYIVRHMSVCMAYANGSVSASLLIYYEKLYLDFLSCFRSRHTRNDQLNAELNAINRRQVPVELTDSKKNTTSSTT